MLFNPKKRQRQQLNFFLVDKQQNRKQHRLMRPQTQQNIKGSTQIKNRNVIRQTRKLIKGLTEQQRFEKALGHVMDALYYRHPRPDAYGPHVPYLFKICYTIQTSNAWTWFLFICTYVYLYLIILDPQQYFVTRIVIQTIILVVYWIDVGLYLYHLSFQTIKISSKFQLRFYIKIVVLILLVADLLVFGITQAHDIRYFRPFNFIRGLLPIFYDALTRKSFQALASTYKDIIVYVSIYAVIILSFALMFNQFFNFLEEDSVNPLNQNYKDFSKAIYITYINSSYDSYPDNQLPVLRWSQWCYILIIAFVLLNMFFFVTIPGTIIFNSFRQTRSKIMLVDEIRQQHSLILAFVSLGEENYHIESNVLIRFLLYMYRNKVRYVNYITEICLMLDANNNGLIQISQFMQLAKILTKNSHMFPPEFDDIKIWIKFRHWINRKTSLSEIVKSWTYKFISNMIIMLTFINCVAFISTNRHQLYIVDDIFEVIFLVDILLRLIGNGYEYFFKDKWNHVDFFLVLIILVITILPDEEIPHNSDVICKMFRIFRITTLIKLFRGESKPTISNRDTIYLKARRLMGQTAIIIPIILKFFPLFLIVLYYLGVLGMELFHGAQLVQPTTTYGMYSEFSHFREFLSTQYIMIQVLTEAGWSMLALDYSQRTGLYYPTVIYFMCCHTAIVLITSSLIRALIWEAYFTVHDQYEEQARKETKLNMKDLQNQKKKQEFAQIREIIEENGFIIPNTVIKRQFLENKLDLQIFKRLKQLYIKKLSNSTKKRSGVIQQIVLDRKKYLMDEFSESDSAIEQEEAMQRIYQKIIRQNLKDNELEAVEQEDFEEEMEELLQKIILHPKTKYSQTIVYPKVLLELLEEKMTKPFSVIKQKGFDINRDALQNRDSILFHKYELDVLLGIERSERDQKMEIIKYLADNQLISEQEAKNLFSKKVFERNYHINVNYIIRKMFLHQTNEQLINKFEIEYFSDIYGQRFKEINKVTIEPLLRFEALLTYNLKNIMRYPQMTSHNFFQIFSAIEDKISNNLLKKGSLFKFVFQIQDLADNWFTIEFKDSQQISIHFIKTGLWIYNKNMLKDEIYYARDLFKWNIANRQDKMTCEKILKLLYQTFEGLAFGLLNEKNFFKSNPTQSVYDLFSYWVDVKKQERYMQRKLQISKVMLVMLSKQQQRPEQEKLQYELSQIVAEKSHKKDVDFKFDESEKETFQKLKNLAVMDHERIIESEGLPFAYVINLMTEVKDILTLYGKTLVNQVEKVLNEEFDQK